MSENGTHCVVFTHSVLSASFGPTHTVSAKELCHCHYYLVMQRFAKFFKLLSPAFRTLECNSTSSLTGVAVLGFVPRGQHLPIIPLWQHAGGFSVALQAPVTTRGMQSDLIRPIFMWPDLIRPKFMWPGLIRLKFMWPALIRPKFIWPDLISPKSMWADLTAAKLTRPYLFTTKLVLKC